MARAIKTRFSFRSEAETLVGNLFLPEPGKPVGVVVSVGPLTSVKEQASGAYAQAMAERGYAALAFDYTTVFVRASRRASSSPIPEPPPVTKILLPVRFISYWYRRSAPNIAT